MPQKQKELFKQFFKEFMGVRGDSLNSVLPDAFLDIMCSNLSPNFFSKSSADKVTEVTSWRPEVIQALSQYEQAALLFLTKIVGNSGGLVKRLYESPFKNLMNIHLPATPAPANATPASAPPPGQVAFKNKLQGLMGSTPVTDVFSNGLEAFLGHLNYFNKTSAERLAILNSLRETEAFMTVLLQDRRLTAIFLKQSVNNEPDLIAALNQNRLGQNFLRPRQIQREDIRNLIRHGLLAHDPVVLGMLRIIQRPRLHLAAGVVLEVKDLNATTLIGKHVVHADDDFLRDFRCPISASLITKKVAGVKMSNGQIKYFDDAELRKAIRINPKNPLNNQPLKESELIDATSEYRSAVKQAIKARLIQDYQEQATPAEAARKAEASLEEIVKELKWTEVPQSSLSMENK